jgi:asparagine synthase (glutamine-hydrolysing)
MPAWLWRRIERRIHGRVWDVFDCTAIRADYFAKHDLAALARERDFDISCRSWRDGFAMRLWAMSRFDVGNWNKGTLAGWGIDQRDPLADRRLVEYCLSVPTDEYLSDGVSRALAKRALADRLPPAVLNEWRDGYQAADWHEGLTAARTDVAAELDRLSAYAPAARALDIDRMKRLVANWPTSGWNDPDIVEHYRGALLRGISAGHFLRKASGAN